jgi:hypothetical protein
MKDSAVAPEIADPYAALEKILKIVGRSWLSEEWRLEDIRLLAQDAIATRGRTGEGKRTKGAIKAFFRRSGSGSPLKNPASQGREMIPRQWKQL